MSNFEYRVSEITSNKLEYRANYSRERILKYGTDKLKEEAKQLGVTQELTIDDPKSVVTFILALQVKLMENPAVKAWAEQKASRVKYLFDGKFGEKVTLEALNLALNTTRLRDASTEPARSLDRQNPEEGPGKNPLEYRKKADYSRPRIKAYGKRKIEEQAKLLGVRAPLNLTDDRELVIFVTLVQRALIKNPKVKAWASEKPKRLKYLDDGKFGETTIHALTIQFQNVGGGPPAAAEKRLPNQPPKRRMSPGFKAALERSRTKERIDRADLSPQMRAYLAEMQNIEAELRVSHISQIPYTEREPGKLPPKGPGTVRVVLWGDSDTKVRSKYRSSTLPEQENLNSLQRTIKSGSLGEIDFVLSVGDHLPFGRRGDRVDKYRKAVAKGIQEFRGFGDTPFAITIGNHDLIKSDPRASAEGIRRITDTFRPRLEKENNYDSAPGAYSFQLGNATFVVFNKGDKKVTDTQIAFFERKSQESEGAVYLVNHIPPVQHAHGPGLPKNRSQKTTNFDRIRAIAARNIEAKGRPFYILSGHDHFHHAIGNFINPGGTGANYKTPGGRSFKAERSIAVADIDKATGKIKRVYFRSASSGFTGPISEQSHTLAWGRKKLEAPTLVAAR